MPRSEENLIFIFQFLSRKCGVQIVYITPTLIDILIDAWIVQRGQVKGPFCIHALAEMKNLFKTNLLDNNMSLIQLLSTVITIFSVRL